MCSFVARNNYDSDSYRVWRYCENVWLFLSREEASINFLTLIPGGTRTDLLMWKGYKNKRRFENPWSKANIRPKVDLLAKQMLNIKQAQVRKHSAWLQQLAYILTYILHMITTIDLHIDLQITYEYNNWLTYWLTNYIWIQQLTYILGIINLSIRLPSQICFWSHFHSFCVCCFSFCMLCNFT